MLNNMTITKRVALGILIPMIGLVILGAVATWEAYRNYKSMVFLGYVSETINELAALTHNLQVERGQTAIFIGSGATVPQQALLDARKATNMEKARLHEVLEHVKQVEAAQMADELAELEAEIGEFVDYRNRVDAGSVTLGAAMKQYSKTISHIIEIGFHASKMANNAELALETVAMLDLAEAKEFAGQERGLVAGLISAGAVTTDALVKLEKSIGKQETLIDNFIHNQPLRYQDKFKTMLADIETTQLDAYRDALLKESIGEEYIELDAKTWFAVATNRIVKLREIEMETGKIIQAGAAKVSDGFLTEMIIVASISVVVLLLAVLGGYFIARSISTAVRGTSNEMEVLANGDVEVEISQLGKTTELGVMADALQTFKENALRKIEMEKEADEERERAKASRIAIEQAKDKHNKEVETVVQSLGNALQRLADGDLSKNISTEYAEEFQQLKNDFGHSITKLSAALNDISDSTAEIGNNSHELRRAADDLAMRTEQQAAALEQTSAALEEITSTVKESADRASEARTKASQAKESTNKSGDVVKDAVEAMGRIESASEEISQIIGVIDDIAFQTNLLALNAGVEAARAGEAGKGFAVVAQEVRELAQRSANAAKEIKDLITNSGVEVSNGVSLVQATGEALQQISVEVNEIDEHVQSIARASAEQSAGLTDINRSVSEMDQVTQSNAAMVEETNAVTHRLSAETETLSQLVSQFRTVGSAEPEEQRLSA
ncbi:MAG: nitrate- and nitrite sensing domain-containing protein [Rhizobiaceae bacterium]|nr:nitrate- and nitrite sensing domain-containing protein [Rhizobiaceae bacterium]